MSAGRRRGKRIVVVHCHPVPDSYGAAIRDRVVAALRNVGHVVDVVDLYADGFAPRLTVDEWRTERVGLSARPWLADDAARLSSADRLVFVYPTWFGGPPAMLKGWFDRLFMEGVAYVLPEGADRIRPQLRNIRRVDIVTTHGASKLVNTLQGEPGKRMIFRGLRLMFHPLCRTSWTAQYGLDKADPAEREAFLARIDRRFGGR